MGWGFRACGCIHMHRLLSYRLRQFQLRANLQIKPPSVKLHISTLSTSIRNCLQEPEHTTNTASGQDPIGHGSMGRIDQTNMGCYRGACKSSHMLQSSDEDDRGSFGPLQLAAESMTSSENSSEQTFVGAWFGSSAR